MLSPELIAAVQRFEGFEPTAKWDYKQWTNGFGTKALAPHEHISETVAYRRLVDELTKAQEAVERFAPGAPGSVEDALTDFSFNAGTGWEKARLGQLVKAHKYLEAAKDLESYDHAGGRVLKALALRRAEEAGWIRKAPTSPEKPVEKLSEAEATPVAPQEKVAPEAPQPVQDPYGPVPMPKGSDPTTGGGMLSQILDSVEAVL